MKEFGNIIGNIIGDMAHDMDASGWYAPSMNLHRSPFGGRNFEYYSEDPFLTGILAASEISGAKDRGVYAFMKHFALNEQETNRWSMLTTWSNEQSIREICLKPFEMAVKNGGAQAVMSSYNYIGTTYAGANQSLLGTVLRDEWLHYEHGEPSVSVPIWQTIAWIVVGVLSVMLVVLEVISIKRFLRRR